MRPEVEGKNPGARLHALFVAAAKAQPADSVAEGWSRVFGLVPSDTIGITRRLVEISDQIAIARAFAKANGMTAKVVYQLDAADEALAIGQLHRPWKAVQLTYANDGLDIALDRLANEMPLDGEVAVMTDEATKLRQELFDLSQHVVTATIPADLRITLLRLVDAMLEAIDAARIGGLRLVRSATVRVYERVMAASSVLQSDAKSPDDSPGLVRRAVARFVSWAPNIREYATIAEIVIKISGVVRDALLLSSGHPPIGSDQPLLPSPTDRGP